MDGKRTLKFWGMVGKNDCTATISRVANPDIDGYTLHKCAREE